MRGMNSETVDLFYLDPPFNSARNYQGQSNKFLDDWSEKQLSEWEMLDGIRNSQELLKQKSWWSSLEVIKEHHSDAMYYYISFMAVRLIEMRRILKPTGSLYLHCDDSSNSYLRMILDIIFGHKNGAGSEGTGAEITWRRSNPKNNSKQSYGRVCDTVYCYRKSPKFTNNPQYTELDHDYVLKAYRHEDEVGRYRLLPMVEGRFIDRTPWRGFTPPSGGWRHKLETRERLHRENRVVFSKNGQPSYKKYRKDSKGTPVSNLFTDIEFVQGKEKTGWETQKPLELLHRIIKTSSNEGDLVFDPFAGCATTIIAAHQLNRQFIGCEIDKEVTDILIMRCQDQPDMLYEQDITVQTKLPVRNDVRSIQTSIDIDAIRHENIRNLYGPTLYARQNGQCAITKQLIPYTSGDVDHITPLADGGSNELHNLRFVHVNEHTEKNRIENTSRSL